MKSIRVHTAPPYTVEIGGDALARVGDAAKNYTARVLLTDANVAPLYAGKLSPLDLRATHTVPSGERSKSFAELERVLDFMVKADLDRASCLIALGGGVIGDLGGLAASLYMRGIAFVQVPTTLLAQVDSSVGGKTAVNLSAGKNLAGTFHQPSAVFADTSTLATLSDAEYRSGLGEVLKTALIEGDAALDLIERGSAGLRERDPAVLEDVVASSVRTKAGIVERDPTERGERKKLNLGHTFAHGIEHAAGYGALPHGQAVAVGLMLALEASRTLGLLADPSLIERARRWLVAQAMPHDLAGLAAAHRVRLSAESMLAGMRHDKKGHAGRARLVLPRACGDIAIDVEMEPALLERVLAAA